MMIKAFLSLLLVGTGLAGAADVPDYGVGFEQFFKLGMPDTRGAAYVKLTMYGGMHDFGSMYGGPDQEGNAWLVKAVTNGPSRFVYAPARVMDVYEQEFLSRLRMEEAKEAADEDEAVMGRHVGADRQGRQGGAWEAADLAADVSNCVAFVVGDDEEGSRGRRSSRSWALKHSAGSLILNAAHYYRHGYTNEANRIAAGLFETAGDSRKVLLAGLNTLADAQYADAYAAFRADRDWAAFHAETTRLLKRFPMGWRMAKPVGMLAELLAARAADAPPPEVTGEGVSDSDRALAAELAELDATSHAHHRYSSLWLLPTSAEWHDPDMEVETPLTRILSQGAAAIPLLLALMEDRYLMVTDARELRGRWSSRSSDDEVVTDEVAARLFAQMSRPALRSDVARYYLEQLLPVAEEHRHQISEWSDAEVAARAREWYKQNGTLATNALARFYMVSGHQAQKQAAVGWLIAHAEPEDLRMVETYLIEAEEPQSVRALAEAYVTERGAEVRPFAERYIARLRKVLEEQVADEDEHSARWMRRELQQGIRRMEALMDAKSPSEMLADIGAGKTQFEDVHSILATRMQRLSPAEALTVVLDAAVAAEGAAARSSILGASQMLRSGYSGYARRPRGRPEAPPAAIAEHAESWRALLEDESLALSGWGARPVPVAETTAWLMETLYSRSEAPEARNSVAMLAMLGRRGGAWVRERAHRRLQGVAEAELPAIPEAIELTGEVWAGFRRTLLAPGADVAALLESATPAQLLAVLEAVRDDDPELDAVLLGPANRITAVYVLDGILPQAKAEGRFAGQALDPAIIRDTVAWVRERNVSDTPLSVGFYREACAGGTVVTLWNGDLQHERQLYAWGAPELTAEPRLVGYVQLDVHRAQADWPVTAEETQADEAPEPVVAEGEADDIDALLDDVFDALETELADADEAAGQAFWDAVEAVTRHDDLNVARMGWITIQRLPAAEKQP